VWLKSSQSYEKLNIALSIVERKNIQLEETVFLEMHNNIVTDSTQIWGTWRKRAMPFCDGKLP
jgi:hypothetical protein